MTLTHEDLLARAEKWLWGTNKSTIVLVQAPVRGAIADALGFGPSSYVTQLECKVSRSDFLADQKKYHRLQPRWDVGSHRFYLTPPGLLKPSEIPERWGLLEAHKKIVRRVKDAQPWPEELRCRRAEQGALAYFASMSFAMERGTLTYHSRICDRIETMARSIVEYADARKARDARNHDDAEVSE